MAQVQVRTAPASARNTQTTPVRTTPQIAAPGEVEVTAPVGDTRIALRKKVSAAMAAYQNEFGVSLNQMVCVLGVSPPTIRKLRYGLEGTSETMLAMAHDLLRFATEKNRASRPSPAATTSAVPAALPAAAPVPADKVLKAILVRDASALAAAFEYDFKTLHRLQRLPDGSILVTRET